MFKSLVEKPKINNKRGGKISESNQLAFLFAKGANTLPESHPVKI